MPAARRQVPDNVEQISLNTGNGEAGHEANDYVPLMHIGVTYGIYSN